MLSARPQSSPAIDMHYCLCEIEVMHEMNNVNTCEIVFAGEVNGPSFVGRERGRVLLGFRDVILYRFFVRCRQKFEDDRVIRNAEGRCRNIGVVLHVQY